MKLAKVEDVSSVAKKLTVEVPAQEIKKELDKMFNQLRKEVRIKGFRPGKTPRSVLERYYGPAMEEEAAQRLIAQSAPEALDQASVVPVVEPSFEPEPLKKDEPFVYTISVEIAPEIDLDGYFELELKKEIVEVTDELVNARLDELRQQHATLTTAEEGHAIEPGDYVQIDLTASRDGQEIKDGSIDKLDVIVGQGRFQEKAEEALIGQVKGAEVEATGVEFPAGFFHDALANQTVDLKMTVSEIRSPEMPEMNDEFAQGLGADFKTVDDLRDRMKSQLEESAVMEADRKLQDQVLDKLLDKVEFELPQGLVVMEQQRMVAQLEQSLARQGLNLREAGIFEDKLMADMEKQARRKVSEDLILAAVAGKEELKVDDDELDEGFADLARQIGQSPQKIREFHEEQGLVETFRSSLLRRKTLKRILAEANIEETKVSADQAAEAADEEKAETQE